jgi:hypothetical protein
MTPHLAAEAARIDATRGRSHCGHALLPIEAGVVRLAAEIEGAPTIDCPACALMPLAWGMPSGCYLCLEPDVFTMAFAHDASRLIALVSLCFECAAVELDDDPESLLWSPTRGDQLRPAEPAQAA